jgi:hypothetical protein
MLQIIAKFTKKTTDVYSGNYALMEYLITADFSIPHGKSQRTPNKGMRLNVYFPSITHQPTPTSKLPFPIP